MPQPRICSSFGWSCKHASPQPGSFLDLPEDLRHRIYYYQADNTVDAPLRLRESNGDFYLDRYRDLESKLAAALETYGNLRLVSRRIRIDVDRSLCKNYQITIYREELSRCSIQPCLDSLCGLLRYCKHLTIVLNYPYGASKIKFAWNKSIFREFLPIWKVITRRLSQSESMSTSQLDLFCDVEDVKTANLILEPLKQLRVLKSNIWLNANYDANLQCAARKAVLQMTDSDLDDTQAFRFLDLPVELRHRILSLTHLVMPDRELQWWTDDGKGPHSHGYNRYAWWCDSASCNLTLGFCSTGERSTSYPICDCFRPPIALSLVCKAMLQDARHVFFSSNRLIIQSQSLELSNRKSTNRMRFDAATFLTKAMPHDGLASLRDLEIVFPSRRYLDLQPVVYRTWERAFQIAAKHLRKLRLTLYLGYEHPYGSYTLWHATESRAQEYLLIDGSEASLRAHFAVHEKIVRPIQLLRPCMNAFHVYACHPLLKWQSERPGLAAVLRKHERELEAMVMGSEYDGTKEKELRRDSRWLKIDCFERDHLRPSPAPDPAWPSTEELWEELEDAEKAD